MQTSGKKRPVASANPATAPLGSCVGVSETANAVPLVPSETTTSPGWACTPRAAPALSPAPAAMGIPESVVPPNALGAVMRGVMMVRSVRRADFNKSSRYVEVTESK